MYEVKYRITRKWIGCHILPKYTEISDANKTAFINSGANTNLATPLAYKS